MTTDLTDVIVEAAEVYAAAATDAGEHGISAHLDRAMQAMGTPYMRRLPQDERDILVEALDSYRAVCEVEDDYRLMDMIDMALVYFFN